MKTIVYTVLLVAIFSLKAQAQVVSFNSNSGYIASPFWLKATVLEGYTLYYTLNGELPTEASTLWRDSLYIHEGMVSRSLATIPTSDTWQASRSGLKGAVVMRWMAKLPNATFSHHGSLSFFLDPPTSWPIVSLIASKNDFFSPDSGIYVQGNAPDGNFHGSGEEWERRVETEFFTPQGNLLLSRTMGVRIHGRSSRANPQKSLRLYASSDYGMPFVATPLFGEQSPERIKRIVLRAPEKLFSNALIIDETAHALARRLNLDAQLSTPVNVMLNGEYWGISSMRERHDEYYIKYKYGIDEDDVVIVEWDRRAEPEAGTLDEYNRFTEWLREGNKNGTLDWERLNTEVDMPAFMDYLVIQIVLANKDWPNNNVRMWKQEGEGRWRFFFYDCDACMQDATMQPLQWLLEDANDGNPVSLIVKAFENHPNFKASLLEALSRLTTGVLTATEISQTMLLIADDFRPFIAMQSDRWHTPENIAQWNAAVKEATDFIQMRYRFLSSWMSDLSEGLVSVYPIPSDVGFTIQWKFEPGEKESFEYLCIDAQGRLWPVQVSTIDTTSSFVSTEALPTGVYTLYINTGMWGVESRFMVVH